MNGSDRPFFVTQVTSMGHESRTKLVPSGIHEHGPKYKVLLHATAFKTVAGRKAS